MCGIISFFSNDINGQLVPDSSIREFSMHHAGCTVWHNSSAYYANIMFNVSATYYAF